MVSNQYKKVRLLLLIFIVLLALSGLTAVPVQWQLSTVLQYIPVRTLLHSWLTRVLSAYTTVNQHFPFLLYGYDWLAFAHLVLAILFIGPYRDPLKNIWVIQFGMIACGLVIPVAFLAGALRGIPVWWRLIDCSFGVFGFALLWFCYTRINRIEHVK